MIATRFRPGAISESSSSHLPPSVASKTAKPVTFPPGSLSPGTMPLATGSARLATIGIVRVSCWRAAVGGVPYVTMMSGWRPTNSCASARIRLVSSPNHRRSIRRLRPSLQPKSARALVSAERRFFDSGSFSSRGMSTPMRRTRLPCCARVASGHAAAPSDELAPSKANAHLALPFQGTVWRRE